MGLRDLIFRIVGEDLSAKAFESFKANLSGVKGAMAGFDDRMRRMGGKLQEVGNTGTAVFGAGVALGLRDMIRDASEFEAALNRLQPVLKLNAAAMGEMSALAIEMGGKTKFSAIEAADAMEVLARNGLDAAAITGGALQASLDIAASSGASLGDAADLATDAMLAFWLGADDLAGVADRLVGTLNESKYSFDDYKMALGQAGGVAGGVGVEFDDMNAALAATAHLFAGGSDAGTSFKVFLQRLVPQSSDAAAVIENLGLQFFDAQGQMRSMAEIAGELQEKFAGLSEEARTDALSNLFGTDAMRTAIGLMDAGAEGIARLDAAIKDASAAEMAEARMKGAAGAMERFAAARETLNISVGASGVLDGFTDMTNRLAGLIGQVSRASPALMEFAAGFSALGVAMSGAAVIIGGLVAVVGGPVAAVIAGVAAIGAAIWTFRDEIGAAWAFIQDQFERLPQWAQTMTDGVIFALRMMTDPLFAIRTAIEGIGAAFRWLTGEASAAQAGVAGSAADMSSAVNREMSRMAADMAAGGASADAVSDAFAQMENDVTGNSYVPDMVDAIAEHFGRLKSVMTDPAEAETARTAGMFDGMAETVAGRLGKLAGDGALTWENMWGEMLSTGTSYRNRILSEVGNTLASGLSSAIFGGGAGGATGGGLGGIAGSFLQSAVGSIFGKLPGFAAGGVFSAASGVGGRDRNVAAFRVSKDEEVSIGRRGESAAAPVVVNVYAQDVASFNRSRAQVGRAIARAAGAGARAS